jgi:hypothetical protein
LRRFKYSRYIAIRHCIIVIHEPHVIALGKLYQRLALLSDGPLFVVEQQQYFNRQTLGLRCDVVVKRQRHVAPRRNRRDEDRQHHATAAIARACTVEPMWYSARFTQYDTPRSSCSSVWISRYR